MIINIDQPHGYLKDGDGKVIQRFASWDTGAREVHDATESVEYVDGATAHDEDVHDDYLPDIY